MSHHNILICGAGIIGLTIAKELISQGYKNILILEKEKKIAKHASGRNSGVLHTGIYYPKDTDKAKYCLKGNYLMQEYCNENNLPLNKTGKVIVTTDETQLDTLLTLYQRAIQNNAPCSLLDEKQLSEIEPQAKTVQQALFSEETCVVDPKKILQSLLSQLLNTKKVKIQFNTLLINKIDDHCINTSQGKITFDYFINCAGAHSDTIAHLFDKGKFFQLIPFKGVYKQLKNDTNFQLNTCIYPVPNLENPFLGVHFTKSISNTIYLGPTATPAFSRENYRFFENINKESLSIILKNLQLFILNSKFRHIAINEPQKYISQIFYNEAKSLVKQLNKKDIISSLKVGIRPQLINTQTHQLVMDFIVEKGKNDIHILNAISPAFTSSMAFAKKIVKLIH